jgi:hypothetical protein
MIYFTKENGGIILTAAGERALAVLGMDMAGLGALDLDGVRGKLAEKLELGCRVPFASEGDLHTASPSYKAGGAGLSSYQQDGRAIVRDSGGSPTPPPGRFPANLLISDNILDIPGVVTKSRDGGKNGQMPQPMDWGNGNKVAERHAPNDSGGFSRYFSLNSWTDRKAQDLPPLPSVPDPRRLALAMYLLTMGSKPGDVVLALNSDMAKVAAEVMGRDYLAVKRYDDLDPAKVNVEVAI